MVKLVLPRQWALYYVFQTLGVSTVDYREIWRFREVKEIADDKKNSAHISRFSVFPWGYI